MGEVARILPAMMKRYTMFDHTADIGLLCKGDTKEALFEAAAEGMFSILIDLDTVTVRKRQVVHIRASSYDDLLIQWLQELLYLFSTKHYLYAEFSTKIHQTETNNLELHGICGGEPVNLQKHNIFTEIKTATYHQLSVKQYPGARGWEGRVIFDI